MQKISLLTGCLFSLLFIQNLTAQEEAQREPEAALSGLELGKGLEATLFAAEPNLLSPTNIDVDARGRVWVCEVVNYRRRNGERPEGDRILIFEDTDGDGVSDTRKVFYQGRDIDTAMGICVLGNQVIVSVAPHVFIFTDEDGDDKADKKETLFSNTGQPQHDHSNHAFIFGPDGKLYWNFGNTGQHVHDAEGKPVISQSGHPVIDNGKPYRGGMVFRCNLDGSEFEVLGNNFRNNYEVTVDSFGTLWQSDNDDDGNRAVRINYVMEYGNYGYREEFTGGNWREPRPGMHTDIPLKHWHLRDPGVVPNLLQTGAGSPTGICVYEGRLLPEVFWDQVIHCDAGPNIVRAYPVQNEGAGYQARIENILEGTRDKWFRPSDVCVAPDGSLFIADWYDPGVGGHRMGDTNRGRLFRIAPPNTPYNVPTFDVSTPEGAAGALKSPNAARRYLAWTALNKMSEQAEKALLDLTQDENPRLQARAWWLLGLIEGRGEQTVEELVQANNKDLRILSLRLARRLELELAPVVAKLVEDDDAQVLRECAITLRLAKSKEMPKLWAKLSQKYDGKDRWYLEALGIGAAGRWDRCLAEWFKTFNDTQDAQAIETGWKQKPGRDILWRSRAKITPEFLVRLIQDPETPAEEIPRYLRAFDFLPEETKNDSLSDLAFQTKITQEDARTRMVIQEALLRVTPFDINKKTRLKNSLNRSLDLLEQSPVLVKLISRYQVTDRDQQLLTLASTPGDSRSLEALRLLLDRHQRKRLEEALDLHTMELRESSHVEPLLNTLGSSGDGRAAVLLLDFAQNEANPLELRRTAIRNLGKSNQGAKELLAMVKTDKLENNLKSAASAALYQSPDNKIRQEAAKLFPQAPSRNNKPLPPINELVKKRGNYKLGKLVYNEAGTCVKCHKVNVVGKDIGPALTEIGSKLSREAMYEAILFPSAGISHNYETWTVIDDDGNSYQGLKVNETDEEVTIKTIEEIQHTIKTDAIEEMVKQEISLMPADLQRIMTEEELVNLVEYLMTLTKK